MASTRRGRGRRPASSTRPKARATTRKAAKARSAARATKAGKATGFSVRAFEPTFTVDDVARSEQFYTRVIGFVMDQRWTEDGQVKGILLKAGNSRLGLSQDDWSKGRDRKKGVGLSIWCAVSEDIDALAARIEKAGGRLSVRPTDEPGLGRSMAVDDPDGFRLRFYRRG